MFHGRDVLGAVRRSWLLWCSVCAACASVSPDPERMAADLPAPRALDPTTRTRVDEAVGRAVDAIAQSDFATARRHAEAALRDDPRSARARAVRARCLMEQARRDDPPSIYPWREAEGELRRAERLAPTDPRVALWHAEFLIEDGHRSAAIDRLTRQLDAGPVDPDVVGLLASAHYDVGDESKAAELLVLRLELVPDDARSLYMLAQCHRRRAPSVLERAEREPVWQAAVAAFERYVALAPEDGRGWRGLGQSRYELVRMREPELDAGALASALAALDRAVELDADVPQAHFDRGFVLEAMGSGAGARRAYRDALQRDPEHLPSLLNLAASLAAAGEVEDARAVARRALALPAGLGRAERERLEQFVAGDRGADR